MTTPPLPPDDPRRPPADTPPAPYSPAPSADAPPYPPYPPYPQEAQGAHAGGYPPPGPYGGQYGDAGTPASPYAGVPTIPGGQYAPPAGSPYPPPQGAYTGEQYPPGQWQGGYAPYAQESGYPPYVAAPPYGTVPPGGDSGIGPERVPWHWYDLLIAGFPFILIAILSFAGSSAASDTATQDTITRSGLSREAFLVLNLVGNALIYGFLLLLVWWRSVGAYKLSWAALGVRKAPVGAFLLMIPVYVGMALAAGGVGELINRLFFGGQGRNPQIDAITGGGGFSWVALICAILSASVIAPIVEELFFRGMLYGWLRTRFGGAGGGAGIVGAVALDGLIFAAVHGIGLILASIFIVGITLAIVYERTKSTLVTITLHALFNSVTVAVVFISLALGIPLT